MKSIFITLCAAALCGVSQAQITILASDFPSAGARITGYTDTSNVDHPGNGGSAQTWDFSQAQPHDTVQIEVVDIASTDWADDFPTATQAVTDDGVNYGIYSLQSGSYRLQGIATDDMPAPLVLSPPMVDYIFPLTYNANFSGERNVTVAIPGFPGSGFYQIIVQRQEEVQKLVDGWGTVTTPLGTFQALRVKETALGVDSMFQQLTETSEPEFMEEQRDTVVKYIWLAKDRKFPVAEFEDGEFRYARVDNLTVDETDTSILPTPFPNPVNAGDPIVFSLNGGKFTFMLFDTAGRQISTKSVSGNTWLMPTQGLAPGIYRYSLISENLNRSHSGSVIIR